MIAPSADERIARAVAREWDEDRHDPRGRVAVELLRRGHIRDLGSADVWTFAVTDEADREWVVPIPLARLLIEYETCLYFTDAADAMRRLIVAALIHQLREAGQ